MSLLDKIAVWQHAERVSVQPRLCEPVRFPYGPFRFQVEAGRDVAYEIEASTNLKTWSPLCSSTADGEFEFVDADASKFSYRFYRLNVDGASSEQIIGYATVTLPPGFSIVANPVHCEDARVQSIFKGMPDGTAVSCFDARLYQLTEATVHQGRWSNGSQHLDPGIGAIVYNPSSDYKSLSFVGEVIQGSVSVPIPAGFSLRGSPLPQAGKLDAELGFPIQEGDVIHLFDRDRQRYVQHPFEGGGWKGQPPVVGVGEGFWIAKKEGRNWITSVHSRND